MAVAALKREIAALEKQLEDVEDQIELVEVAHPKCFEWSNFFPSRGRGERELVEFLCSGRDGNEFSAYYPSVTVLALPVV